MQRQILPPLACTVKSVVYISGGGGSWGGGGVRGEVGLAQKTQNGKSKFINLLLP